MTTEAVVVALFALSTAVALGTSRLRIPYTVGLVVAGLTVGALRLFPAPNLTRELLFAVFLPGLIFEAAFGLDIQAVRRTAGAITLLAVPGVVVGIALVGVGVVAAVRFTGLVPGMPWRYGFVFGALVAATDPIAVVALFRSLRVPEDLRTIVEGESLLNDGTSIVFFSLILAFVSGAATGATEFILGFIRAAGGGVIVGLVTGWIISKLTARVDDPMVEITLTVIAAYGTFVIAETIGVSGVIATVVAGLLCSHYLRGSAMSHQTQMAAKAFWDYVAFALNSVVFLLIGFSTRPEGLLHAWRGVVIAYLVVLVARAGVVISTNLPLYVAGRHIGRPWRIVLTWGGLRGALSMVLALSIPSDMPYRGLLITLTFGIVILSILLQGITMPLVLRATGVANAAD